MKYIFWTIICAAGWTSAIVIKYGPFMPVWATVAAIFLFVVIAALNLTDKSVLGVDPPKSYLFIWGPVIAFLTILIGVANSDIVR